MGQSRTHGSIENTTTSFTFLMFFFLILFSCVYTNALRGELERAIEVCCRLSSVVEDGAL